MPQVLHRSGTVSPDSWASGTPADRATAEIGLGLAALGRPGYINLGHCHDIEDIAVERMERAAHDVPDAA